MTEYAGATSNDEMNSEGIGAREWTRQYHGWSDPADLWIAGGAPVESPIAVSPASVCECV